MDNEYQLKVEVIGLGAAETGLNNLHKKFEKISVASKDVSSANVSNATESYEKFGRAIQQASIAMESTRTELKTLVSETIATVRATEDVGKASKANADREKESILKANSNRAEKNALIDKALKSEKATQTELKKHIDYLTQMIAARKHYNSLVGADKEMARGVFVKKFGDVSLGAADEAQSLAKIEELTKKSVDNVKEKGKVVAEAVTRSENLHQVWRGLAASSGQIWLSWGKFLPMMAGMSIGGSIVKSFNEFREFGWQLEMVGAAAEAGFTEVERLKGEVLSLADSGTIQGPQQLADGLRVLAQAGLTTSDAFKALKGTMDLALVGEISDAKSALIMANSKSIYGMENDDGSLNEDLFNRGASSIAKAAAVSQTSVENLTSAMRQAGPAAARFGMGINDVNLGMVVLAKAGVDASMAGTAFRNFLTDLSGRTPKASKALQELGLSMFTTSGETKPFIQMVTELQDVLQKLNTKDQNEWISKIFGERGARMADRFLSTTKEDLQQLELQLSRSGENFGYASSQAERLKLTLEGTFRQTKNSLTSLFIVVGKGLESNFKSTMKDLTALFNDGAVRASVESITKGLVGLVQVGVALTKSLAPLAPLLVGFAAAGVVPAAVALARIVGITNLASSAMVGYRAATAAAALEVTFFSKIVAMAQLAMVKLRAITMASWIGVGVAVVFAGIAMAMTHVEKKVYSLADALKTLPEAFGFISTEITDKFDKFGLGKDFDFMLNVGIDVETSRKLGKQVGELQLEVVRSVEDAQKNLVSINYAAQTQIGKIVEDGSRHSIEQGVMVRDRQLSFLINNHESAVKHLQGKKDLTDDERNYIINSEETLFKVVTSLSEQRHKLLMSQLADEQAAIIENMGFWKKTFTDDGGRVKAQEKLFESGVYGADKKHAYATGNAAERARLIGGKIDITRTSEQSNDILKPENSKYAFDAIKADPAKGFAVLAKASESQFNELTAKVFELKSKERGVGGSGAGQLSIDRELAQAKKAMAENRKQFFAFEKAARDAQGEVNKKTASTFSQVKDRKVSVMAETSEDDGMLPSAGVEKGRSGRGSYSRAKAPEDYNSTIVADALLQKEREKLSLVEKRAGVEKTIYGYVSDSTLEEVSRAKASHSRAEFDKETERQRKTLSDLRLKQAKGGLTERGDRNISDDIKHLEASILSRSEAGVVNLGQVFTKVITEGVEEGVRIAQAGTKQGDIFSMKNKPVVTSRFGPRNGRNHNGIDLRAPIGTGVHAPFSGTITNRENKNAVGGGKISTLTSDDGKMSTTFMHLSKQLIDSNTRVEKGVMVALTGDTGSKGQPHLHQEFRVNGKLVDPKDYMAGLSMKGGGSIDSGSKIGGLNLGDSGHSGQSEVNYKGDDYSAKNAERGLELAHFEATLSHEKEIESIKNRATQTLKTAHAEEVKLLELDQVRLNYQKELGYLTYEEHLNQQMLIDLAKIKSEEKRVLLELEQQGIDLDAVSSEARIQQIRDEAQAKEDAVAARVAKDEESRTAMGGLRKAYTDMVDESVNYGKAAQQGFSLTTGHITDAFETMATTGKANFKDMARSIVSDLTKIIIKMLVMQAISYALGGLMPAPAAPAPGVTGPGSGGAGAGGVLNNLFARGGVVEHPTTFGMAGNQTGLMGEAGSEAIMPLTRMGNGDLGVMVSGGGGSGIYAPVNVSVVVHSDGTSEAKVDDKGASGMGEAVKQVVIEQVSNMLRPRGLINNAIKAGG